MVSDLRSVHPESSPFLVAPPRPSAETPTLVSLLVMSFIIPGMPGMALRSFATARRSALRFPTAARLAGTCCTAVNLTRCY
jgi:hypothetical protein